MVFFYKTDLIYEMLLSPQYFGPSMKTRIKDEVNKQVDLGVPRCCGAFTPSTRLVSIRRGRGWFLFRI